MTTLLTAMLAASLLAQADEPTPTDHVVVVTQQPDTTVRCGEMERVRFTAATDLHVPRSSECTVRVGIFKTTFKVEGTGIYDCAVKRWRTWQCEWKPPDTDPQPTPVDGDANAPTDS